MEPGTLATGVEALRKALEGFIRLKPTLKTHKSQTIQVGDVALAFKAGLPPAIWSHYQDINGTAMCAEGMRLFWEKRFAEES